MRAVILVLFFVLATPFLAAAEEAAPPILPILEKADDARPLRPGKDARVTSVIDATRINLNDDRIVELPGIEIPQSGGYMHSLESAATSEFLKKLFEKEAERDVQLYETPGSGKGRVNRLGHDLAHVVRKTGHVWVQGALIANGLARAWPTPSNPELWEKMYALEDEARKAGRGLWAESSPHRLLHANDMFPEGERFAVVEGTIKKIATINNVTYLNFGDDWKKDFTIGIASPVRQSMGKHGTDALALQGRTVRVRGWMRPYNGPYIELEMPELLEILPPAKETQ